jgi:all-trans-8'-apo-beta-carotenal 15,15'-oxygenase
LEPIMVATPRTPTSSNTASPAAIGVPAPVSATVSASDPGPAAEAGERLARRLWTEDLSREHGFEPLTIEGALPAELRGTLYRNGPGQFGQHGRRYSHPFEGDGAVTAVRFEGGRALGASRITPSAGLVEERAAGRILYGLAASWPRRVANMLRWRQKNTANTSVVLWQGRLFALMEGAEPTELDPRDLSMIGETDLGGTVVSAFSAHPHRVESRRAIYNFGVEYGRKIRLHLYELPDAGGARHLGAVELAGPPMLHDFIATETHLVFFVSPVRVHVPRMLLQVGSFAEMFRWRPELGTEVICVPIDRPAEAVRFTAETFFQWHFANAFTRGRELVIDYVRYPGFSSFYEMGRLAQGGAYPRARGVGRLHRAVIDPAARALRSEPLLADRSCEFPTVASARQGAEQAATYLALDDLRAIGKLDRAGRLEAHALPGDQRVTEPIFVARPGAQRDDDGWVLALCHDGPSDRAFLAVYDAARIPDGPIARAWFDHQVPITFHGQFQPQA